MIGQLQYATCVVVPGKPFLCRLIDLTINVHKPYHFVRITNQAKEDLQTWFQFLASHNGKNIIAPVITVESADINLGSDASKTGYGATYGTKWIQGTYPVQWQAYNIALLELFPIFLIISIFRHQKWPIQLFFYIAATRSSLPSLISKAQQGTSPLLTIKSFVYR